MNPKNFFAELKRRNVFKVAVAYAIVGWLIIQVFVAISGPLKFPEWVPAFIIILVAAGFPIALIIAWAFELTPDGLKKTDEVHKSESISPQTGKRINRLIIGALSILIVFLLAERIFFAESTMGSDLAEVETLEGSVELNKTIAVLPFDDFKAGGEQEYFADGLTEEILNVLARTPDLQVASRTSSFQFKDVNLDARSIADTLGVAHILEGSVRQSDDKIRITAQLIRASDGFHLWSETYDNPKTDIIEIQEDIAFKIAQALETVMNPEELEQMLSTGTKSVEAYQAYIKSRAPSIEYDKEKRYEYLNLALQLDPTFAQAYNSLAALYQNELTPVVIGYGSMKLPYEEKLSLFNGSIDKAIEYAVTEEIRKLYEARKSFVNLDFRRSLSLLDDYLNYRPKDTYALNLATIITTHLHERGRALSYCKSFRENMLDNADDYTTLIANYFWSGAYSEGAEIALEGLKKFPYNNPLIYQSHRILLWSGDWEEATALTRKITVENFSEDAVNMVMLRQACMEQDEEKALYIYNERMTQINIGSRWIALRFIGRDKEAYNLIRHLDEENQLFSLSTWLHYPYFDYSQFPNLRRELELLDIHDAPLQQVPFALNR